MNTAPVKDGGTHGEDRLKGKRHMKARVRVMDKVFTKEYVIEFLKVIGIDASTSRKLAKNC